MGACIDLTSGKSYHSANPSRGTIPKPPPSKGLSVTNDENAERPHVEEELAEDLEMDKDSVDTIRGGGAKVAGAGGKAAMNDIVIVKVVDKASP